MNLRGADLSGVGLRGADLRDADLQNTIISRQCEGYVRKFKTRGEPRWVD